MKKILAILMLSILAIFAFTGCQSNKASPATQTSNQATGSVVDTQANDAQATANAVDTTQVDKDLSGAGTSLNNW